MPHFDLLQTLVSTATTSTAEAAEERAAAGAGWIAEIIQYRGDRIAWIHHVPVGKKVRLPGLRPIGRHAPSGLLTLDLAQVRSLSLWHGGRELAREEWAAQVSAAGSLQLTAGQQANVELANGEWVFIHLVVSASPLPKGASDLRPTREHLLQAGSSLGAHVAVLAFAVLGTLGQPPETRSLNEGRFAKINLATIELEQPPPPPEPIQAPKSTTKTAATTPEPAARELPTKMPVAVRHDPTPAGPARDRGAAQAPPPSARKILSALGGGSSTTATSAFGAVAMTNLDAVGETAGGGGFKVSGVIGKLPGDGLRVASAGSGTGRAGADTKSIGELGGSDLGKVEAKAGTTVRARVTSSPQAVTGEGSLDRGQIQRVVNAHVHQVQGCYERQLVKTPTLSGKITFEWVIGTSGGVSVVRVRASSLPSSEVASCIQSAISGWRFPAPSGGSVTVTYPFAFSALSQ